MIISLFFSTKCQECMNLWQVISNEGIDKMFNLINLDTFSSQQLSKLSITQIPTIVISNQNQQNDIRHVSLNSYGSYDGQFYEVLLQVIA